MSAPQFDGGRHARRAAEEHAHEDERRRTVLALILDGALVHQLDGLGLVELVHMIGLETQLEELAVGDPERQRAIRLLRRELELPEDGIGDDGSGSYISAL